MNAERRPVELVPHDPVWAEMASAEGVRLATTLGAVVVAVHHIGSTSIAGIKAKPIVDLMPVVTSLSDLDAITDRVRALGYEWRGEFGIAGRRFCPLSDPPTGKRLIHVHFFAVSWPEIERHLNFRDYLRVHADEAREYEAQKVRAAALHPDDMIAYSHAKGPWIAACLERATAWALTRRQPS